MVGKLHSHFCGTAYLDQKEGREVSSEKRETPTAAGDRGRESDRTMRQSESAKAPQGLVSDNRAAYKRCRLEWASAGGWYPSADVVRSATNPSGSADGLASPKDQR